MAADGRAPPGRRADASGAALDRSRFVRPIAHRGLHDRAGGRIENTAPAFLAAIAKGYGIECDLQAARDGAPMVFHDSRLDRLVEATGPIAAFTPSQLARLRHKDCDTGILSLAQFLELVAGRVPLLIEVKRTQRKPEATYLENISRQASSYRGPIALMSFDRRIVAALGELAPAVPRGPVVGSHQLAASLLTGARAGRAAGVARLMGAAPGSIGFFAVDVRILRLAAAWLARHRPKLPLFTWTVRTAQERQAAARWADAPIFEGYQP